MQKSILHKGEFRIMTSKGGVEATDVQNCKGKQEIIIKY